jgi:predicted naringenin-chalcone synthase
MSLASFADGYASLLVTDMRPLQWPTMAVDALDSIRSSLEKLNQDLAADAAARGSLRNISEEINGLARMIDEMIDVEGKSRQAG